MHRLACLMTILTIGLGGAPAPTGAGKAGSEMSTREPGDLPRQITSSGGVPGQAASTPADPHVRAGVRAFLLETWPQHRFQPCPAQS